MNMLNEVIGKVESFLQRELGPEVFVVQEVPSEGGCDHGLALSGVYKSEGEATKAAASSASRFEGRFCTRRTETGLIWVIESPEDADEYMVVAQVSKVSGGQIFSMLIHAAR